ncbi:8487_t:CDS:2 [Ambispora gerdemannii]|uniref:DNA repair protein RAD14 n=1 Tax=Ambispora gerdemannii TaxID=144530 RepID=A0A9N9CMJ7_9GLOM|nr:8487_t:CDS:2 [Ambispora gerdemannii]
MVQTRSQTEKNIRKDVINNSEERHNRETDHDLGGSNHRAKRQKVVMTETASPNSEKQEVSFNNKNKNNIVHPELSSSSSVTVGLEARRHTVKDTINDNNVSTIHNANFGSGFTVDVSTESFSFGVSSNSGGGGFIVEQDASSANSLQTSIVSKYFAGSTKTVSSLRPEQRTRMEQSELITNEGGISNKNNSNNDSNASASQNPETQDLPPLKPLKKFQNYVDYDFSKMRDSRDPRNFLSMDMEKNPKCNECDKSIDLDFKFSKIFGVQVCFACKNKFPEKYSLLTKTEVKEDYLLTDAELRDEELLPHWLKPNPHKSTWNSMMLFLRMQVEAFAFKKWGGEDGLDREYQRRQLEKQKQKEKKFKTKIANLRKRTRTDEAEKSRQRSHTHEFGPAVLIPETGVSVQTCDSCGIKIEVVEF